MIEPPAVPWDGSLENLFAVLDEACRRGTPPPRLFHPGADSFADTPPAGGSGPRQPDLFAAPEVPREIPTKNPPVRAEFSESRRGLFFSVLEGSPAAFLDLRHSLSAPLLFELSADAFDALIHAWMSELPIGAEMARFAWRVIAAAQTEAGLSSGDTGASAVSGLAWAAGPEARHGAEQAAFDRGDPDVRTVLEAAYKARREIDRLMGLLRFSPRSWHGSPGGGPVYVARCSPDHYILPGLAEHFTRRFGDCPWAIIDEKRHLILFRQPGGEARLVPAAAGHSPVPGHPAPDRGCPPDSGRPTDDFEDLWRNYHRSVNNPDRNNPALQRQFMPRRYWKYLPELQ